VRAMWLRRTLRWAGWAATLLTAPLWVPVLFVGFATELAFLPGEWRVRRRMRRAGRWLPRAALFERLRAGAGTLLVEWPTPGWRFCRAWWVPEVIERPQDLSEPREARRFDRWCHARYTDLERGAALLVAVWWGERVARRLERRFVRVAVVRYCSFIPDAAEADEPNGPVVPESGTQTRGA
jgi:hypothetical protein